MLEVLTIGLMLSTTVAVVVATRLAWRWRQRLWVWGAKESAELCTTFATVTLACFTVVLSFGAIAAFVAEAENVDLETKPALQLSCALTGNRIGRQEDRPTDNFLLELIGDSNVALVDGRGAFPARDRLGDPFDFPDSYPRCDLTNAGRLPLLAIKLDFIFRAEMGTFQAGLIDRSDSSVVTVRVPALQPGSIYHFGLLNGADRSVKISLPRIASIFLVTDLRQHSDIALAVEDRNVEPSSITRVPRGPLNQHDAEQPFMNSIQGGGAVYESPGVMRISFMTACVDGYTASFPPVVDECFDRWGHPGQHVIAVRRHVRDADSIATQRELFEELRARFPSLPGPGAAFPASLHQDRDRASHNP